MSWGGFIVSEKENEKEMEKEIIISDNDKQRLNEIRIALEQSIVSRLDKAGLYHRSMSRVKSDVSLTGKFATGKYHNGEGEKKIQDIIGVRINLFFFEDINICESIINKTFKVDNWSKSERKENHFEAQKRNCVCRIPSEYIKSLSPDIWDYALDQTFEVQLRTLLFEGWHEIEHDMRYKNKYGRGEKSAVSGGEVKSSDKDGKEDEITVEEHKLSRVMNSVIANLELCDWSIVEIYDRLAELQLKSRAWERALQSRYRLNMAEGELCPAVREYFDKNPEVAREFYSIDKNKLVEHLLTMRGIPKLTPNRLLYYINSGFVHDGFVENEILKIPHNTESSQKVVAEIKPLTPYCVFKHDTYIKEEGFKDAADIIYSWGREHMKLVFPQMSENVTTCTYEIIGNKISVNFDETKRMFNMDMQHISSTEPGVIWHVSVKLNQKNKKVKFTTRNICESYHQKRRAFNRPEFVGTIDNQVGIIDAGYRIGEHYATMLDFDELDKLIHSSERLIPIAVVSRYEEKPDWAQSFAGYVMDVRTMRKSVAGLCHFVKAEKECMDALKKKYPELNIEHGGVLLWRRGEYEPQVFTLADIQNSDFEEARRSVDDDSRYEKAFRFRFKELVREEFVQ
jgi:ppGpp synthetase/RelA/SpoT-type nucleotidyltranferase